LLQKKAEDDWKIQKLCLSYGYMSQHSKPKKGKRSATDVFFDAVGAVVPSCGPALRMVERGQARPLKLSEKFVLFYNTPLCLHCNCNRAKFKEERAKMRESKAAQYK
jgi:hypothetical protein